MRFYGTGDLKNQRLAFDFSEYLRGRGIVYIYEVMVNEKAGSAFIPDTNESVKVEKGSDVLVLMEAVSKAVQAAILEGLLSNGEAPKATRGHRSKNGEKLFHLALEVPLPEDDMFSIEQAMGILKVTQPRVSHLIRDGRLVAVKQGRRRWITRASMEAYLKTPRTAGRPSAHQNHMFDYAQQ